MHCYLAIFRNLKLQLKNNANFSKILISNLNSATPEKQLGQRHCAMQLKLPKILLTTVTRSVRCDFHVDFLATCVNSQIVNVGVGASISAADRHGNAPNGFLAHATRGQVARGVGTDAEALVWTHHTRALVICGKQCCQMYDNTIIVR